MSIFKRRLDWTNRECERLLQNLDAMPVPPGSYPVRKHDRFDYRVPDIPLCVEHPDGGKSCFLVFGRNLSEGGISFLHGGYAHPNSHCMIMLKTLDGKPVGLTGFIRHCRLIRGSCHEIGLKFEEEIDVGLFLLRKQISISADA